MSSVLGEYIKQNLNIVQLEQELLKLIGEYNKLRNTYLIVYAAAISKQIPAISLNMDDYYIIYDVLRKVTSQNADMYIETPGGSGEAAEEIVTYLRQKFSNVDFVIAGEAKSAGTLMALSGNNILLTNNGSLGPIDAQIKIGRSPQSAYDYMDWIKKKQKEALKTGKLNPFDATMVAQISPGELNGVSNALNFAHDLVINWLPKYKFKDWNNTETRKKVVTEKMKKTRARQIVSKLIDHNRWRSHGRSIKIADLENIGLKITSIDSDPKLAEIVYKIQTVVKLLFETTTTYKIVATEHEKLFRHAATTNPQIQQPLPLNSIPEVVNINVKCSKCQTEHNLYAKLIPDSKIDVDMKMKGLVPFPKNNIIICRCGNRMDIKKIKDDMERQAGKKIL